MEDKFWWDNSEDGSQTRIKLYFDEFSAEIRRKLLSKNISKPSNIYELLYSTSLETQLAKNVETIPVSITQNSEIIKDAMLAKNIEITSNLLQNSQVSLQNQETKNNFIQNSNNILQQSQNFKESQLSKNINIVSNLLKSSAEILAQQESANSPVKSDLLTSSAAILVQQESANSSVKSDLLTSSAAILAQQESANSPVKSDLLTSSAAILAAQEALTVETKSDLLTSSAAILAQQESANSPVKSDLLTSSAAILAQQESANSPVKSDLLTSSAAILAAQETLTVETKSDLLASSAAILAQQESANSPVKSDLLTSSAAILAAQEALTVETKSDLLTSSAAILAAQEALTVETKSDLLTSSAAILAAQEALTVETKSDLLTSSAAILAAQEALTVETKSDLLTSSAAILAAQEALTVETKSDLLTSSAARIAAQEALTVETKSDLLTSSAAILAAQETLTVETKSDLLTSSAAILAAQEALTVETKSDLLTSSAAILAAQEALTVETKSDLLTSSAAILAAQEALTVETKSDLLTSSAAILVAQEALTVETKSDLLTSSAAILAAQEALTVETKSDLINSSSILLNDALAQNIPSSENLLNDSSILLNDALAQNSSNNLDLLSQSSIFLNGMLALNVPSVLSQPLITVGSVGNLILGTAIALLGGTVAEIAADQVQELQFYNNSTGMYLRQLYGTSIQTSNIEGRGDIMQTQISIGQGFASTQYTYQRFQGTITQAIRDYNISRNLFNQGDPLNGSPITQGNNIYENVLFSNPNQGFQQLLAFGGIWAGNSAIGSQPFNNATPQNIIQKNNNQYLAAPPDQLVNPDNTIDNPAPIGSANSMLSKGAFSPGNSLDNQDFQLGNRGVRYIINTIAKSNPGAVSFTNNFNTQKATVFVTGIQRNGSPQVNSQRYSVQNPYGGSSNAQTVVFALTNYSSNQTYHFPPYIEDYSENFDASWQDVNFLGRPEPVYTYNHSSRGGTISFFVLTDYAQNITIGTDWLTNTSKPSFINVAAANHFTTLDTLANQSNQFQNQGKLATLQNTLTKQQQQLAAINLLTDPGGSAQLMTQIQTTQAQINALNQGIQLSSAQENKNPALTYIANGQNAFTNPGLNNYVDGYVEQLPTNTVTALNDMIKNLAFQPGFFSGDKVDFRVKMDFLGKLTKPASAPASSSFSFIKAPYAHIKMGDYWDNDIVIDSINMTYTDSPWSLDLNDNVQPLWAKVSMNFKFIGPKGPVNSKTGIPTLSDSVGGIYSLPGQPY